MKDKNGLTFKQAAFVEHVCTDCKGNATQAALKANYAPNAKNRYNVCAQLAYKLVNNGKIKLAIQQKLQEIAENKDVSVEWIVEKLKKGYDLAVSRNNVLATARFLELLGKYKAMFTDNVNQTDTQRQRELDARESEEASELARLRLAQKYGLRTAENCQTAAAGEARKAESG